MQLLRVEAPASVSFVVLKELPGCNVCDVRDCESAAQRNSRDENASHSWSASPPVEPAEEESELELQACSRAHPRHEGMLISNSAQQEG